MSCASVIDVIAVLIVAVVVAMEDIPWDQHRGVEFQTVAGSLNAAFERIIVERIIGAKNTLQRQAENARKSDALETAWT